MSRRSSFRTVGDRPEAHALLALMGLNASRLDARTDDAGDLLLLKEQDRERWDRHLLGLGLRHLDKAASGGGLTRFHYEAGIAACHALAPTYEATDWRQLVFYYDGLMTLVPSPIVALNRAAALAMRDGDEAGL